jgi:hypothetical protein
VGSWTRRTNTFTLYEVKGRTVRVSFSAGVSIAQADALIAALANEKVRFANGTPPDARRVDLTRPEQIVKGKMDKLRISFSCGDVCTTYFECELDDEGNIVLSDPISIVS